MMLGRAWRLCMEPGCGTLTRSARCERHAATYDTDRGTTKERGYAGRNWMQLRAFVLARDPVCKICGRKPSRHCDHIKPKRTGGKDTPSNLQGLCASCHNRKTATEDKNRIYPLRTDAK